MTNTYRIFGMNGEPLRIPADEYRMGADGKSYIFTDGAGVVADIPRMYVNAIVRVDPPSNAKAFAAAADDLERVAQILNTASRDCTEDDLRVINEFTSYYEPPLPQASDALRGAAAYLRRSGVTGNG